MTSSRHLSFALAIVFGCASGCYAPDVRDCTITCTGPDDCAGDQSCNSAGLCAAEGVTCSGGSNMGMIDAPTTVMLKVQVMGTGKVVVVGIGECDENECMFTAPRTMLRFDAVTTDEDKPFEKWTSPSCAGAQMMTATCTYTPASSTATVAAKFR